MNRQFDPNAFIDRIGKRLVDQFDDARMATTPSLVGDAMEKPALGSTRADPTQRNRGWFRMRHRHLRWNESTAGRRTVRTRHLPGLLHQRYAGNDILPLRRRDCCRRGEKRTGQPDPSRRFPEGGVREAIATPRHTSLGAVAGYRQAVPNTAEIWITTSRFDSRHERTRRT